MNNYKLTVNIRNANETPNIYTSKNGFVYLENNALNGIGMDRASEILDMLNEVETDRPYNISEHFIAFIDSESSIMGIKNKSKDKGLFFKLVK
jgi:hypothetical protein